MSKPMSFKESLVAWRTMADNVAEHLDEMPHLRKLQESLAALVEHAQALLGESQLYESKLRDTNRRRMDAFVAGRELRNRLVASLQGTLGQKNERLIEFGVAPRPRHARRHRLTAAERAAQAAGADAVEEPRPARARRKSDPSVVN